MLASSHFRGAGPYTASVPSVAPRDCTGTTRAVRMAAAYLGNSIRSPQAWTSSTVSGRPDLNTCPAIVPSTGRCIILSIRSSLMPHTARAARQPVFSS